MSAGRPSWSPPPDIDWGGTDYSLSERFGVCRKTIRHYRSANGLKPHPRGRPRLQQEPTTIEPIMNNQHTPAQPITLTITKEPPNWISGSATRTITELLEACLTAAGVKGAVQAAFSHEQNVLKGRPPAMSVRYHPSHRTNTGQSVFVVAAGKEPRNDQTGAVLQMPGAEATRLRNWLANELLWEMPQQPKKQPHLNGTHAPVLDEEAAALFLDGIREFGGTVTRVTANAIAAKMFGGETKIVAEAIIGGLLSVREDVCSLTDKGSELVKRTLAEPEAPRSFDSLRATVQQCRSRLEEIRAGHGETAGERTRITNLVSESSKMEKTAQQSVEAAKQRLAQSEAHHASCRQELLKLERSLRELPPDRSADIAVAQKALTAAEKEYRQFVEI